MPMMPARMAGGTHSEANRRGMASILNEPKTTHKIPNKTIASMARTRPATLARVRLLLFKGEGEFDILSPHYSISIISKVCDQYSPESNIQIP